MDLYLACFSCSADYAFGQRSEHFGEKGKIMIGHCAAAMLFDFTGITEGKKLAVHPLAKPSISKGQATDEDSVVDGNFFTAKEEHYICTMMPQVLEALKK